MHNLVRFTKGEIMAERFPAPARRTALWTGLLVLASVVFSLGFACAVPLAAFAALAALTLSRRDALLLVGAVWLANQIAGFTVLHYPLEPSAFAWGAALGAIALASTLAAQWVKGRVPLAGGVVAFFAAFAVYEGSLVAISLAFGSGISNFTPSIVRRILAINFAAFAALYLIHRMGVFSGLAKRAAPRQQRLDARERQA
jgi:hypothetical protein